MFIAKLDFCTCKIMASFVMTADHSARLVDTAKFVNFKKSSKNASDSTQTSESYGTWIFWEQIAPSHSREYQSAAKVCVTALESPQLLIDG